MLKGNDYTNLYHLGKANVVVDALSHKSIGSLAYIVEMRRLLIGKIHGLEVNGARLEIKELEVLLAPLEI